MESTVFDRDNVDWFKGREGVCLKSLPKMHGWVLKVAWWKSWKYILVSWKRYRGFPLNFWGLFNVSNVGNSSWNKVLQGTKVSQHYIPAVWSNLMTIRGRCSKAELVFPITVFFRTLAERYTIFRLSIIHMVFRVNIVNFDIISCAFGAQIQNHLSSKRIRRLSIIIKTKV